MVKHAMKKDTDSVFAAPAVYVNQFFVTVTGNGTRIAFGEVRENHPVFIRAAVMLPHEVARGLAGVLATALAPVEQQRDHAN